MTPSNWTLASYTVETWTDLVAATSGTVLKTVIATAGGSAAEVKLRLADSGGSSLATLIPSHELVSNSAYSLSLNDGSAPVLSLVSGQKLQVWADVAGVEFSAFGASE